MRMILQATLGRRAANMAIGGVIAATVLWLCLSGLVEGFAPRVLLFYVGAALAYALMPYVRRSDIPLAAMWLVLAAELAPLLAGQMLSPTGVAADVMGVAMAAGPMFIARARQILQGDLRPHSRRGSESAPL